MNTFNLHALFHGSNNDCYEGRISLSTADREQLKSARTTIRGHVRSQIARRLQAAGVDKAQAIAPKFITQGSFAYGTINAPAYPPRQQADLDDGLYVPLSFCEDTGSPNLVSALLIDIVEAILTDLAKRRGWTVDTGNPNCTRLVIAHDKHVDMPIYSIPDDEFLEIAQARFSLAKAAVSFNEYYAGSYFDDTWDAMPAHVWMAHKVEGWIDSDPRPIRDWVLMQVRLKSEQLRRLMRYLKAWRDHQNWPKSDPKSILLMALVDAALDRKIDRRDDLALIQVCSRIPGLLCGSVEIPPIPGEDMTKRLDEDGLRAALSQRVRDLHDMLSACVKGRHTREEACRLLQSSFGIRFPNRPDRIRIEIPEAPFRARAPQVVTAAPFVGRQNSG